MSAESPILAYAPADLSGRRPPVWVGVTCLLIAALVLLSNGFFGVLAGNQAVQLSTGLREARRVAALPTRAVPPAQIALAMRTLRQTGPINPSQVGTLTRMLADPAQRWVMPTVPLSRSMTGAVGLPAGGIQVTLVTGGHGPHLMTEMILDAAGRLVKADAVDWSTEMRTTATVAADGTVSTATYHRQHAPPAVVLAIESAVTALAGVTGLIAIALAAAGLLLLAGRPRGWPLLRRVAVPLVAAGGASVLAVQAMWWAMTIGNTIEPAKATLWCVPGLLSVAGGIITVAVGRRSRGTRTEISNIRLAC
jgi:hypothetical protein